MTPSLLEQGRALQRSRGEGGAEAAIALYQRAIAQDPSCAACYWELGWSYQVLSRWPECLQAWDQVHAIDPRFPAWAEHYANAKLQAERAEALAMLPTPEVLPEPEEVASSGATLRLAAVGDVQMGRAWPAERATLPDDPAQLFAKVEDALQDADITFGNLETALLDDGDSEKCGPESTKCFAFRVPTAYATALKDAGFDVMSIANNHTGDFGEAGRVATAAALDAVGILHSGPIGDIARWTTKDLEIALVAFSTGGGVYAVQDVDTAARVVADLATHADIVIVSFHGGAEGKDATRVPDTAETFYGENRGHLRAFAHAVVDAGADLVLGHGPHVLRGAEVYRKRLIAYSLGNFCSWNTFGLNGPLGESTILQIELAANGVLLQVGALPVKLVRPGIPEPDAGEAGLKHLRDLSRLDFPDTSAF
jgi:poly-gamma-glutamate capsule biosynthesis protein CapA/YwtB (metallophosphatase superfamily)